MKINIGILLLPCLLTVAACQNDVENSTSFDSSVVKPVENFTDKRDGHVYKCIQVGNQIWMAENLSYRLPLGVVDGCSTWKEDNYTSADFSLPDEEWMNLGYSLLDDASYDWAGKGVNVRMVRMMIGYVQYGYSKNDVLSYLNDSAPAFYEVFVAKADEAGREYGPSFAAEKLAKAEAANSNYSKSYGFLYTFDGAQKAVPEGWRLPTDEDWKILEQNLGMAAEETDLMNAWRGKATGKFLKTEGESGFDAKLAGGDLYDRSALPVFDKLGDGGYFWSSTLTTNASDSIQYAVFRSVAVYSDKIWRGAGPTENGYRKMMYSVRCVKSINH